MCEGEVDYPPRTKTTTTAVPVKYGPVVEPTQSPPASPVSDLGVETAVRDARRWIRIELCQLD